VRPRRHLGTNSPREAVAQSAAGQWRARHVQGCVVLRQSQVVKRGQGQASSRGGLLEREALRSLVRQQRLEQLLREVVLARPPAHKRARDGD
jgi:hypothetical protein